MQTKELELQMASIKLQDQALLVERADVQSRKMSEAFTHMQTHKNESDKLLESYNERFKECQQSIEKSNEVCLHPLISISRCSLHVEEVLSSLHLCHSDVEQSMQLSALQLEVHGGVAGQGTKCLVAN